MPDSFPFVYPPTTYTTQKLNHGGGISAYQVVGSDATFNEVGLTTASSLNNQPPIGIALHSVSNGVYYPFVKSGIVINGGWSFSSGKVYLDGSGNITQNVTGLAIYVPVGFALSATSIYFDCQGFQLIRVTL